MRQETPRARVIRAITITFLLSAIATSSLGETGEAYSNPDFNFSFSPPNGWELIPIHSLSERDKQAIEHIFPEVGNLAVFTPNGKRSFGTPFALLQSRISPKLDEHILHKVWRAKKGRKVYLENKNKQVLIQEIINAQGFIPDSWKGAQFVSKDLVYDKRRHTSVEKLEFYHADVGKIVVATARMLGSQRITVLRFYFDGDNADSALDIAWEVANSFRYDEGYGFGEGKKSAKDPKHSIWVKGPFYFLLCTVGFWAFISFLQRWADN